MRLVVGYDRDLARVCLRRNLMQLVRPGAGASGITEEELDYFNERLLETVVFAYESRFGTPWVMKDESLELLKVPVRKVSRAQAQQCEMVANNVLVYEGVIARSGAVVLLGREQVEVLKKKLQICSLLFQKARVGGFRSEREVVVLHNMSRHVFDWVRYLSLLQGNDYMDLLASEATHSSFLV